MEINSQARGDKLNNVEIPEFLEGLFSNSFKPFTKPEILISGGVFLTETKIPE
jgi:hypothetical protein